MTALPQSTRRKLSLLKLAEELGNVSRACRIMGYHRDTFYEIKRAFQVGGVHALVEQKRGPRGPHPNRVSAEIEAEILAYALEHPTWGQQRVANELRLKGHEVGPGGVRGVWLRHEIETRHKRLLRLETVAQGETLVLSEEQMELLERHSVDFRCRHIESTRPGEFLNQDTFYWGSLKSVGKVYVQVVVDVFRSLAFAKVYTSKDADHRARHALRPGAALLRGAGRRGRRRADRQRARILRQARPPSLRAAAGDGRDRAPHHQDPQSAHQRLRRAHEPHPARRVLPRLGSHHLVPGTGGDPARPRSLPRLLQR